MHPQDQTTLCSSVGDELVHAFARFADLTAMHDEHHNLSYAQLAGYVGACESALREQGTVAIYGAPTALMAATATACVVHGRPFVHLDPAMPTQVLQNIVAELAVKLIYVCQSPKDGQLPSDCATIDAATCLRDAPDTPVRDLHAAPVRPDDAIYVVATSGTTGRPKCIPVTQDSAYLSYQWRDTYTPYDTDTTVGIYIFAIWEMFRPLRQGATLCFPSVNALMTPKSLATFLIDNAVTEMLFTPSFFEKTLQALSDREAQNIPLRRIVLNGEVVSDDLIRMARHKLPGTALWNLYSICETHDISISLLTEPDDTGGATEVGIPMPHIRAIVLDDQDQPCPAGQPGLLHFEGPRMLGPGYINRPEETALRFRELTIEGAALRLYDTGDQGCVDANGRIFVLGRVAHMLKLRGHSIQTRELTDTMRLLMGFSQAIPWVQKLGDQGQALIFYFTATAEQAAQNQRDWGIAPGANRINPALAKRLRAVLPAYCVPTYLVHLDEIPINDVSGKCDFKRLPPVTLDERGRHDDNALPCVACAAAVMGCETGLLDPALSFHDQGGDSLMCVNFLQSLEKTYDRRVDFELALNVPLGRLHDLLTAAVDGAVAQQAFDRPGILLTGATGFLGQKVLAQAARQLPAGQAIYCLVRPKNRDPQARLADITQRAGISADRVVLVPGSLEDTRLGLGPEAYDQLTSKVSTVIHCAAMVNLAVDPDHMERWSHAGVANIIQFCRDAVADLRFTSSVAVFPDTGGPYAEAPTTRHPGCSGYGAAKIAAEHLIADAGIPAAIIRLPSLYDLSAPNPKDIYEVILAACRKGRIVPRDLKFTMIDVHAAARFLVDLPRPQEVTYLNFVPGHLVEVPDDSLQWQDWLAAAPLTEAEKKLISEGPEVLCADAGFENGGAAQLWKQVTSEEIRTISDPETLLRLRLSRPALAAS